jgi:hypothetical protein
MSYCITGAAARRVRSVCTDGTLFWSVLRMCDMDLGMRPKGAGGGAGWCSSGSSVRGIRFACSESLLPSSSHLFC